MSVSKFRSIGVKISLLIAGLVLVISGLNAFLAYQNGASAVVAAVEQALILQAEEASEYVRSRLESQLTILETIAQRPELRAMNWLGQRNALRAEEERLTQFLALGVVDKEGVARYTDGTTADLGDRDYVMRAFSGELAVSELLISRVTGGLVLMYAVPITDYQDQIAGVLIARQDGAILSDITDRLGYGENGWAFIVNGDGTLYAHPDRELVLAGENVFDPSSALLSAGNALQEIGLGQGGLIKFALDDGENRLVGLAPIDSTKWTVGVAALESDELHRVVSLRNFMLGFAAAMVIVGGVLGIVFARVVAVPLRRVQNVIEAVARGDLTQISQVRARDEVGIVADALNATVASVREALGAVAKTTDELASISQEMAASSQEVSASIEEVASTTNEFSSSLDMMNTNAQSMSDAVEDISARAAEGDRAILNVVEQMNLLRDNTRVMSDEVANLGTLSDEIGKIVDAISAIAEQTNLLALNAAIEAARAGEHGRGFAVVADEVRKLAEESAHATAEITALINQIQEGISSTVSGMKNSADQADEALVSVDDSGRILRRILSAVDGIVGQVQSISAGIEQTNAAGHEISSATEEQAASIEEIASSAQELTNMSLRLQELVGRFKLNA